MNESTCTLPGCDSPIRTKSMCQRHYQRSLRRVPPEPEAPTACTHCGARLATAPYGQVPPSYCSKQCQSRASYARRKAAGAIEKRPPVVHAERECERCAGRFVPSRIDARFCPGCHSSAHGDSLTKTCDADDCDRPRRARGLCSMHWKRWARSEGMIANEGWTPARKARWQARYALKRGAADAESFEHREVFDRDYWMCGICSRPVNPELCYPDPMSASLDHVIPVSRGGSHARDNAQCSHLFCNLSKGSRDARSSPPKSLRVSAMPTGAPSAGATLAKE